MLKYIVKEEIKEDRFDNKTNYTRIGFDNNQGKIPAQNFSDNSITNQMSGVRDGNKNRFSLRNWFRGNNKQSTINNNVTPMAIPDSISNEMLNQICLFENSKNFGYKMGPQDLQGKNNNDAGGHLTFGYGLLRHPDNGAYMDTIKRVWTQEELENLYQKTISKTTNKVINWASQNKLNLNQNQVDALVSMAYNRGTKFLSNPEKPLDIQLNNLIRQNPNDPQIHNVWSSISNAYAKKYPGLITRRRKEADWYFGRA